jgi:hypothetical protein
MHLEPTQPPIQWVPALFPQGKSGCGVKLITHFNVVLSSKKVQLCLHSPICLHCAVLN